MLPHYLTLNLTLEATDAEIRERYLQLVRLYPPEKDPQRFRRITEAFESIKDQRARVKSRLFGITDMRDPEEAIRMLGRTLDVKRRRVGLPELLKVCYRLPDEKTKGER